MEIVVPPGVYFPQSARLATAETPEQIHDHFSHAIPENSLVNDQMVDRKQLLPSRPLRDKLSLLDILDLIY